MRVVSDATLVTGSPEGPVSFPPGAPVGLPADDAKDLIARGLARPMPEVSQEQREAPGTGEPPEEVHDDTLDARLNINQATAKQIAEAIKGIGIATARSIVKRREVKGPYQSLDELAEVSGVGKSTIDKHRDLLTL